MIYLDNAATSYPKPEELRPMLDTYLEELCGNPGRSGHKLSLAAAEAVFQTRTLVAEFIGCSEAENIIFTQNATFAINTIIRARIKGDEHVLISDLEHNSVYRPIWRLSRDKKITFSIFSHKGNIIENIQNKICHNTRMLICTHVSNTTGFEFPIKDIASLCRKKGIFMIVDASQSIGHRSINVSDIDCDALCAPGHKGLLGLQGSGFLYVKEKNGLRDVFQGGSGAHSLSPEMPDYLPDRFEAGTLPTPAILSMGTGIKYILERGIDDIRTHEEKLSKRLHEHLSSISAITLFSIPTSGIAAFKIKNISSEDFAQILNLKGICVRGGYHCAPLAHKALGTLDTGLIRASVGAFNSLGEVEVASYHIKQVIKKQGNV